MGSCQSAEEEEAKGEEEGKEEEEKSKKGQGWRGYMKHNETIKINRGTVHKERREEGRGRLRR